MFHWKPDFDLFGWQMWRFSEPVRVLTPHSEHCAGLNWSREGGEKASNNPSSCLEEKSLQLRQSCGQFPRHPFSDTLVWPKWNHRKLPGKEKSSVAFPLSARDLGRGRVSGSCRNHSIKQRGWEIKCVQHYSSRDEDGCVIFFLGKSLIHFTSDLFQAQQPFRPASITITERSTLCCLQLPLPLLLLLLI